MATSIIILVPYILSWCLSVGIAVFVRRYRHERGVTFFFIANVGQILWTTSYILELLVDPLRVKILLDDLQIIGGTTWTLSFLAFAVTYTRLKLEFPRVFWGLLYGAGIIPFLLILTEDFHHLIRPDHMLQPNEPFTLLVYSQSSLMLFLFLMHAIVLAAIIGIFAREYLESRSTFKMQSGMIMLGTLLPLMGTVLTVTGVVGGLEMDIVPITFGIGDVFIALGLFQYHFFDLRPVPYSEVLDNVQDGVILLDKDSRIVEINKAAHRYMPENVSCVVGLHAPTIFDNPEMFEAINKNKRFEIEHHHTPGKLPIILEIQAKPFYDDFDIYYGRIVVIRNITERKRAEWKAQAHLLQLERANVELENTNRELENVNNRLNASNDQLAAISESKDAYVSNVSHELRTPIASLKVNLYMLRRKPERAPELVQRLERDVNQLGDMVEDLLLLSRLDQNRAEFEPEELELNPLVKNHIADRMAVARTEGIELITDLGNSVLPIWGDPGLVQQTLSTLLANALRYTPPGGTVTVSTHTWLIDGETWSGFCVKDTGPGIAPGEQDKVFDRFYRSAKAVEASSRGSGLGLSIARSIVDLHMGKITVTSTGIPGEGSCFTVAIPAYLAHYDYVTERIR